MKITTNENFKTRVLNEFFEILKRKDIQFCVLRNYYQYPDQIGGDVDVLLLPESAGKISDIVREIADSVDGQAWHCYKEKNEIRMPAAVFRFGTNRKIEVVSFDFLYRLEKFGADYIDVISAMSNRRQFKNFFILDKKTEFFHILMHGLFCAANSDYRKRYEDMILQFINESREIPENAIRKFFPPFIASLIIGNLERRKIDKVFSNPVIEKIVFIIKNRVFLKRFILQIKWRFNKLTSYLFPVGEFLAILGPDGVGKSTTANLAATLLNSIGIPTYHYHLGFRPAFLPSRHKFGMGEPRVDNFKPRGLLRYCYHFLDYVLAYYFQIRPCLVRGEIVIAERYFYDYLLHLDRKNLKVSDRFVWWTFCFFMPKPTACVLLTNDPEEILKRRQELTKERIEDVLRKAKELGKTAKRFIEIKTDIKPQDVALRLAKWIVCNNKNNE